MQLAEFISLIREGTVSPYRSMGISAQKDRPETSWKDFLRVIDDFNSQEDQDKSNMRTEGPGWELEGRTIYFDDIEEFFGYKRGHGTRFRTRIAEFIEKISEITTIESINLSCTVKFDNEQGE